MNKKNNDNEISRAVEFNLTEVIIIILITGVVVSVFSGLIVYNNYDKISSSNAVVSNDNLSEFAESYEHIVNSYVKEVDKDKLIDAAIEGMYGYLNDEYSLYLNKDITSTLSEQLTGEYSGIGIEIKVNEDSKIVISKVFGDSPAEEAGLKSGDIITHLDGTDLSGKDTTYFADTVKEGTKTTFMVTYLRNNVSNTVKVKKSKIFIESVTTKEYDSVAYIKIDTFSSTTADQVQSSLDSLSKSVKSLVIDVRDNSGGYLSAANDVADLLIAKGKVIYQLKDRNSNITEYKATSGVYKKFNKIAVIINENSASASEILALALKESADATLIGMKSYGKGTVQETEMLSSGAMVKYTSAYWLSPKGNSINEVGIKPDIEVKDSTEQLNKAIEAVK